MDVLKRGRVLRVLVELLKREPMNMQEFMVAADYVHDPALALREEMEAAKLIVVKDVSKGRERSKGHLADTPWPTHGGARQAD